MKIQIDPEEDIWIALDCGGGTLVNATIEEVREVAESGCGEVLIDRKDYIVSKFLQEGIPTHCSVCGCKYEVRYCAYDDRN